MPSAPTDATVRPGQEAAGQSPSDPVGRGFLIDHGDFTVTVHASDEPDFPVARMTPSASSASGFAAKILAAGRRGAASAL